MSILVVGSVAFDSIETPFGKAERCLGGSATYFSVAASFFTEVDVVAVVGEDFSDRDLEIFRGRHIRLDGLQRVPGEKTFFWSGEYGYDLNVAKTRDTQLNVFADFRPRLDERQRRSEVLFLANIHPELQMDVLHQSERPKLVALDTMNLWIASKRDALEKAFRQVDLVILLLLDDAAEDFGERDLTQGVGLPNPLPVIPNRVVLCPEVCPQHFLIVLGNLD